MYQIRVMNDKEWVVVDSNDTPVFRGAYRDCEEWLDSQQNLMRKRWRIRGLFQALGSVIRAACQLVTKRWSKPSGEQSGSKAEIEVVEVHADGPPGGMAE